mmetsp:Transcript_4927/g.15583  ORF Transcript_4927/g.15583 Transcript_4927/m.15583 type:complete len:347 (-) Transcript_4927:146-1186(-)
MHGGPAVNGADPRSQLYREGRKEVARLRQQQLQEQQERREASQSPPQGEGSSPLSPHGSENTENRGLSGSGGSGTARLLNGGGGGPGLASKYSAQADAEMLRHWQSLATSERAKAEDAAKRLERAETELTLERGRREEAEDERKLLQDELRRSRQMNEKSIGVAQQLEREKRGLQEELDVVTRDLRAAQERIQHISDSTKTSTAAAQEAAALRTALADAQADADRLKQRLGATAADLAKERKAYMKLKEDHGRETKRLEHELGMVRDTLRKANSRADELKKEMVRQQQESYDIFKTLEESALTSRAMAVAVIVDDEKSARARVAEHECAVRVQLGALHATMVAAIA